MHMIKPRWIKPVIGASLVALTLSAQAADTIKIGVSGPLSG